MAEKISWSPEEWVKVQTDLPTPASRLSNYVALVTAVQATILHAEQVAQTSSAQLAEAIGKQAQMLTNSAAKMVLAGVAAQTDPSPAKAAEFAQADAVMGYNHKQLIDLITPKDIKPPAAAGGSASAGLENPQSLVAELTTHVKNLIAWKDKEADVTAFPTQFDTVVTMCIHSFANVITQVIKDGATQLKLLEELQPLSIQGSDLVEKANTKASITKAEINPFFDALFLMLKITTTAVKERK